MRLEGLLSFVLLSFVTTVYLGAQAAAEPATKVVTTSEIEWEQLNPLRGDKSPKAGTLWGNRTGPGPAGFLLKPADGFKSPPHIHNVAYRGVVISGLIHNDDPDAEEMYMAAGSFWTQPAGGVHITAAKGADTLAYIEVEDGFGVLPAKEAFDDGERPINVDASNLVWLDAKHTHWIGRSEMARSQDGPQVAFLWGNPRDGQLNGTLVRLPAGFAGELQTQGSSFRAVVIQGRPTHGSSTESGVTALEAGSYFGSEGKARHRISCEAPEACILYLRTDGAFKVLPS
ncbi:MAG: DUF4437 domain-containing protein [Kiloniellales bacterium]|nr:DUF4437 domain-containing protein [Kiloniellales bacterium]